MKVALINPPNERNIIRRWRCAVEQGHYLFPPLELMYLGGILKQKKDAHTILVDCIAEKLNLTQLKLRLSNFKPDLIVFMPGFEDIENDISSMIEIKRLLNSKLICFGYYPTLFDKEILKKFDIDIIIRGEPEFIFSKLYDALKNGKTFYNIDGITYKRDNKIIQTGKIGIIENIDEIPLPDRNLINNKLYFSPFPDKKLFTTIMTSRGCPYRCTYCVRSYGDKLRQRSVENVIMEIKECLDLGIKTIRVLDDTFTTDRIWITKFCEEIKNRNYKFYWDCLARPHGLDKEVLKKMKDAGCVRILIGVESGSDKILKEYNRYYDLEKIKDLISNMRSVGIMSFAFFMLGSPTENKEDIKKSLELAKKINPDFITLNMVRLYPGTALFDKLKKENKINFNLFPYKCDFVTLINENEIKKYLFKFYSSFYFRLSYILPRTFFFIKNIRFSVRLALEYLSWIGRKTNF